jgi:isopenicillin N synthase-like dioxygenase
MNLQEQTKYLDRTDLSAHPANFETIPVIDIEGLFSNHLSDRKKVADAMGNACRDVGFFYIVNHRIPELRITDVYRVAEEFFKLPLEKKSQYHMSQYRQFRGYFGLGDLNADLHEPDASELREGYEIFFELPKDDLDHLAGNQIYGPNIWPDEPHDFRSVVYSYYESVLSLGRLLLKGFALALDLPETYFDDKITKPMADLALLHYPPQPEPIDPKYIGVGAHTDFECFSILTQGAAGLQVQNNLGQWIEVPPILGSFVINIGDCMARWTNDIFASTIHRVINLTGKSRFSIPFFFNVNYDTVITCLESCQSPERPPRYAPIQAGDWVVANIAAGYSYRAKQQPSHAHTCINPQ